MGLLYAGFRKPLSGEIGLSGCISSNKLYLSLEFMYGLCMSKPKSLEIGSYY